jgi:hypothetical protein
VSALTIGRDQSSNLSGDQSSSYTPSMTHPINPTNVYMLPATLFDILTTFKPEVTTIPKGVKESVYCVLDNASNLERCGAGIRSSFVDDCNKICCAWQANGSVLPNR